MNRYGRRGAPKGLSLVGKAAVGFSLLVVGYYTVGTGFRAATTTTTTRTAPGRGVAKTEEEPMFDSLWKYTAKDIDGVDLPLSKFAGKVGLVVNLASK